MRIALLTILMISFGLTAGTVFAEDKAFGTPLSMEETAVVSAINSAPADYADKDVLVTGKVIDMCRHSGCWVMVETDDKAQILCRSMDESIHFPITTLGQQIRLQGNLKFDKEAPGMEMKAHEGEEPHACPNPQVMVAIQGAVVDLVEAEPEAAPEAEPKAE